MSAPPLDPIRRSNSCWSATKLEPDVPGSFGVTTDETRGIGSSADIDDVLAKILAKFHALADKCDAVIIEGTDYGGASAAFEFDINARIATNLGAPRCSSSEVTATVPTR